MKKEAIADILEEKHEALFKWLENQPEEIWEKGPEGKWTTGQHFLHLLKSIKPLNDALSMPRLLIRTQFGKNNREVRSYETVAERYEKKLSKNIEKAKEFNERLKTSKLSERDYVLNRLQTESKKLQYKVRRIKDKNLDELVLPHPLMGKMPVREIIMWTAHHVDHHTKVLKENY
ncbi:MAG: DinB family protein [Flavobacteriaceae bacterium]|nr:DinB family protein [Flavobacteriaceae bacterium]